MILSDDRWFNSMIVTPIFVGVMFGHFPSVGVFETIVPISDNYRNFPAILTRLYVFTFIAIRNITFKYEETRSEQRLSLEAIELKKLQYDEMRFMSRFAHFSRTSLHGIVNALHFVRKELLFLDVRSPLFPSSYHSPIDKSTNPLEEEEGGKEKGDKEKKSALDECIDVLDTSCLEVFEQTSDLVQYYLIRNGVFQNSQKTNKEAVDIRKLVSMIINVQTKLRLDSDPKKKKKINVTVDVERSVPQFITTDRKYVSKVVTNIVSNSIKYTDEGFVSINISKSESPTTKEERGVELIIIVRDSGCGIKKERQARLFEAFIRNERKKDSFSIGLVITKNIVDLLKGHIEIYSKDKKGTTVTVTLPYEAQMSDDISSQQQHSEGEDMEIRLPEQEEWNRLTDILIVEDNTICQDVLERQVTEVLKEMKIDGVQIHLAGNGREALDMLDQNDFHRRNPIVFCDIDMPVCNGMQFCRIVRKYRSYGDRLAIYSLTAKITGNEEKFCEDFGFDGIHTKPLYPEDVEKILKAMIGERRRRRLEAQHAQLEPGGKTKFEEQEEHEEQVESILLLDDFGEECEDFVVGRVSRSMLNDPVTKEDQNEDERKKFLLDLAISCLVAVAIYFLLMVSPEDFYEGWRKYWVAYIYTMPVQYVVVIILGLSSSTNALITLLRLFVVLTYGVEVSYQKLMRISDLAHVSFIVQANDFIDDFRIATLVSLLYSSRVFYSEISRPFIGIQFDDEVILRNRNVLDIGEKVGYAYLLITIVSITLNFRKSTQERKARWEKIIDDRKSIFKDINHTTAKISHDLATPASALVLYIVEMEKLLATNSDWSVSTLLHRSKNIQILNNVRKYFKMMFLCSLGLELAIHNFLTCCKVKNNMISSFTTHEIDIMEFIQQTLDKCLFIKPSEATVSSVSFPFFKKNLFSFDVTNVRLILLNVVMNAYVHSGATQIFINVHSSIEDIEAKRITIEVVDNGTGIPAEVIENVESLQSPLNFHFRERFQNALGLGLVVCKLLSLSIEGCTFSVAKINDDQIGTKVSLTFPFAHQIGKYDVFVGYKEEQEVEEEEEEGEGEEIGELSYEDRIRILKRKPIEQIRVLCLDDSPVLVKFFEKFIREVGFVQVETTMREQDFLQLVQETKYDILLTDLNLTKMNCLQLIRSIPNERDIPTIVICVTGSPEDVVKLDPDRLVVDAVMTKPLNVPDILHILGRYVSGMRSV